MSRNSKKQPPFQESTEEEWLSAVEKALKGKTADTLAVKTIENIKLKPLYTKSDSIHRSDPGIFPYTRGSKETIAMWKAAQPLDRCATAEELANAISSAAEEGLNAFSLSSFTAVQSKEDFKTLLSAIKESGLYFWMDFEAAPRLMPEFAKAASELGEGAAGCDPYDALMHGSIKPDDFRQVLNWTADFADVCGNRKSLLFKGELFHEAGANAVQELAFTFAKAADYLNWIKYNGRSVQDHAEKAAFSFSSGSDFFMEIAKLRAARLLWSSVASAFEADKEAGRCLIHTSTSSYNKSLLDPHVNLLRTATEAFSAVIGNADVLSVLPHDAESGGSAFSERIARNIHYLLSEESLLSKVNDPGGGSWYIEKLTQELAEAAWNKVLDIENAGGFAAALEDGYFQNELSGMAESRQKELNRQTGKMIGVNFYSNPEDRIQHQVPKRAPGEWPASEFQEMVAGIQPEGYRQKGKPFFHAARLAEGFERLRGFAQAFKDRTGSVPQVQIITYGLLKQYKPRLDFLTGLLASGGIDGKVIADDAVDFHAPIFLCGSDESYRAYAEQIGELAGRAGSGLYVTGRQPAEHVFPAEELTAGMDRFTFLENLQRKMGVQS
ncbi:hypothetical protein GKZ89_02840 [Bacillus mangrovi]|uniref:Methylmalonyl-CoA mutase alpha/beta chain catalytic domain-containing protein n=1 Tax=Metabacillus mangrovi TaxID=1491830 RepID=A0A7X2S355_9BACI|nr:methylmalonyl-CoA mutase family protein [Metabacillus mangrovi]MTH52328.1 hypothetical protein [Metabacillus mangrovi]